MIATGQGINVDSLRRNRSLQRLTGPILDAITSLRLLIWQSDPPL